MAFPATRLRRLRRTGTLRSLVRETRLTPEAFVYPLFVCPGEGVRKEVRSMPGVFNLSVDEAVREAADAVVIRTITAQEQTLRIAEITKREKLERSLMPEGLVAGLTVQELASLLDYLEGLAKAK